MAVKGIRVKRNPKGIVALLQSQEVADDLAGRGERIAEAAGDGFGTNVVRSRDRTVVFVQAHTPEAMRAEAEDRRLLKSINAGR